MAFECWIRKSYLKLLLTNSCGRKNPLRQAFFVLVVSSTAVMTQLFYDLLQIETPFFNETTLTKDSHLSLDLFLSQSI